MASGTVVIGFYPTTIDASYAKSRLEASGIRAFVSGGEAGTMWGLPTGGPDGIRLQVREEDADRAAKVLEGLEDQEPSDGQDEAATAADGELDREPAIETDLLPPADTAEDADADGDYWARNVRAMAIIGIPLFLLELGVIFHAARKAERARSPLAKRYLHQAWIAFWISAVLHVAFYVAMTVTLKAQD